MRKKTIKKASTLQPEEKLIRPHIPKKLCNGIKNEGKKLDEVDSLVYLGNTKEKKKLSEIDERIKLLKTELRTLVGDIKITHNPDYFILKSNTVNNTLPSHDAKRSEGLKTDSSPLKSWENLKKSQTNNKEFNQNCNCTPSKTSEWLDKTIDEMDLKFENNKLDANKLVINSEQQIDPPSKAFSPETLPVDFKLSLSNTTFFSLQKVEQLVYKSFLMQNSAMYMSDTEASDSEVNRSAGKRNQNCKRSRKSHKIFNREKPFHRNFSTSRFLKKSVKRRLLHLSTSPSDIEVIDLDSSSGCNKTPKPNTVCVDLDISNYDWNEPFDVNEDPEFHSDIQVIEDRRKKSDVNCKELKSKSHEVTENDISAYYDEIGKTQEKKAWECPVCFEKANGQEIVATQCGHVFCKNCLENHISKLCNNCPTCRSHLKEKPFITLFNF